MNKNYINKSETIKFYSNLDNFTEEQIEFIDSVYKLAEDNYENGGDVIVECYTPQEIVDRIKTIDKVRKICGIYIEKELDCRWGEDTDSKLERARKFKEWQE